LGGFSCAGLVSRQSRNFTWILINAAGSTAWILLRLCGWTLPGKPFYTGSAVWRPGGLRESSRSSNDPPARFAVVSDWWRNL